MRDKIKTWWANSTFTEKLMYGLLILLAACIATRWEIIWNQVCESFGGLFTIRGK